MADEQKRADVAKMRGTVAAGMQPGPDKKAFIAAQGESEKGGKDTTADMESSAYRQRNVNAVQGSFKKGGHVAKTGLYKLHKGETVVPNKMMAHGKNSNMIRKGSAAMSEWDKDGD
jgi:hypothetical protein